MGEIGKKYLLERLLESAAHGHGLSHALHLGRQLRLRAWEFLESEAGNLRSTLDASATQLIHAAPCTCHRRSLSANHAATEKRTWAMSPMHMSRHRGKRLYLGHNVVDRGLKGGGGFAGDVVGDLVQAEAHG